MKNLAFLVFLLFFAAQVWALNDPDGTFDEKIFSEDLQSIRDPFVSLLPKKVKEPEKAPEPVPVIVEHPAPPVERPAPPPEMPAPPPVHVEEINPFAGGTIKINGIIWNTEMPQAIVNDHVVRLGEDLLGGKIVAIKKDGIEVEHHGKKYTLTIESDKKDETSNR
jgi:hypothetical protein